MARLVRMDRTGHATLAEWAPGDAESIEAAAAAFREQLDAGFYAVVSTGEGHAEQVRELRPSSGGLGSTTGACAAASAAGR